MFSYFNYHQVIYADQNRNKSNYQALQTHIHTYKDFRTLKMPRRVRKWKYVIKSIKEKGAALILHGLIENICIQINKCNYIYIHASRQSGHKCVCMQVVAPEIVH